MGGHGGLNILPQKRWNVYNYENREKVRRDEEEAAREEQLKREQARKRDAEFRLERLRAARGLAPLIKPQEPEPEPEPVEPGESEPKSGHINLFEGIKIFDPIKGLEDDGAVERDGSKKKKMKKEDAKPKIVTPDDEKYRLGYGVAGKGVKLPWYLQKPNGDANGDSGSDDGHPKDEKKRSGKKTLEELREERLKREKREKERERALLQPKGQRDRDVAGNRRFSRR
ncbi:leukocyte receptor cluster member 1-like [Neltuma alba]|uniref:leukocyte receptor cluster member 1-like n=1 Tax=Neltuma alba TaxID=207710 RepID=UPI0010A33324|nr:leukocyte receptor cluster member 1-like [Prosopis alba]XP_028785734.1 leukocyte receptor cluster member 1-like [Prosopis alba]